MVWDVLSACGTLRRRGLNFLSLMICVLVVRESQMGSDSSVSSVSSELSTSRLCFPEAVVLAFSEVLMCARRALEAFNVCTNRMLVSKLECAKFPLRESFMGSSPAQNQAGKAIRFPPWWSAGL